MSSVGRSTSPVSGSRRGDHAAPDVARRTRPSPPRSAPRGRPSGPRHEPRLRRSRSASGSDATSIDSIAVPASAEPRQRRSRDQRHRAVRARGRPRCRAAASTSRSERPRHSLSAADHGPSTSRPVAAWEKNFVVTSSPEPDLVVDDPSVRELEPQRPVRVGVIGDHLSAARRRSLLLTIRSRSSIR